MPTESAYRSSHPDVIAWWEEINSAREAFHRRCGEIADRFPGYKAVTLDRAHSQRLAGIVGYDNDSVLKHLLPPPSPAWRLMQKDMRYYAPYRNHLKDPELLELFRDVSWTLTAPPGGMPIELMVGGRFYTPGMFAADDGTIWYSWGVGAAYVNPDPEIAGQVSFRQADDAAVNPELWETSKLSEFYAAQGK